MSNPISNQNDNISQDTKPKNSDHHGINQHDDDSPSNGTSPSPNNIDVNCSDDDHTKSSRYGCFQFRPSYLQLFNTSKWLLFVLCIYSITMSMQIIGFRGVVIPQMEKRFNMTSTYIGSIMSTVDISAGISGVFLAYFVGLRKKSTWIGYGVITTAVGSLIFIIPHFIAGPYYYGDNSASNNTTGDLCILNSSIRNTSGIASCSDLDANSGSAWIYSMFFILGLIFTGVGSSIQYSAGISYLDENISPRASPFYIGIYHTMGIVGPSLGYVFGGIFTNIYIDWPASPKDITPDDPRWIGAWWLGYLTCGSITLLSSVFIFGYPSYLPSYEKSRQKRQALAIATKAPVNNTRSVRLKDFPRAFYNVVSKKIFFLSCIGLTVDQIPVIGLASFLPKFIQSQSGFSLLVSTTIGGAAVVISAAVGQILGGYLMKRWNLIGSQISRYCFFVCIINVLCSFTLLIHCPNPTIVGVNARYPIRSVPAKLFAIERNGLPTSIPTLESCHSQCQCDVSDFKPVCGSDGLSYISSCLAGCRNATELHVDNRSYSMCGCLNATNDQRTAKTGLCPSDSCPALYALFVGIMISVIITFLTFSPTVSIILRSLPDAQTTFGMGIEGLIFRLGGGLLGPVIFGFLMDSSCTFWKENCGKRQFCWQYDNGLLSLNVFIAVVLIKGLKLVFYGFLWHFHKKQSMPVTASETDNNHKENHNAASDAEGTDFSNKHPDTSELKNCETKV